MTLQPQAHKPQEILPNKICTDCDEPFYDALGYSICKPCHRVAELEWEKE